MLWIKPTCMSSLVLADWLENKGHDTVIIVWNSVV